MNEKRIAINNSPGYYITKSGKVFNETGKRMKTWLSKDGYERIRLTSKKHGRRVNRTIHLLVAEVFLNAGKYVLENGLQINHIDGIKTNNDISNLEAISGTENINHAHNNSLYTYDIKVKIRDIIDHKSMYFRSLRELARYFKVSLNYIRPRLRVSRSYPINNRYVMYMNRDEYVEHISTIKNNKLIYVYDHVDDVCFTLTAFTQISILLGLSYINIGKKLVKYKDIVWYTGGYSFSTKPIVNPKKILNPASDRISVWKKLAMCNLFDVGPK